VNSEMHYRIERKQVARCTSSIVSKSSKSAVQFEGLVGTELELLQIVLPPNNPKPFQLGQFLPENLVVGSPAFVLPSSI
jgi:hypothetical protein